MHEVLGNRLGGLSLPRKSVVRLTDRPDMTLDVYRGRKTTIQLQQINSLGQEYRRAIVTLASTLVLIKCFFQAGRYQVSYSVQEQVLLEKEKNFVISCLLS